MKHGEKLRKVAQKLIREGRMPTLQELSLAVLAARREFAVPIRSARRARREAAEKVSETGEPKQ